MIDEEFEYCGYDVYVAVYYFEGDNKRTVVVDAEDSSDKRRFNTEDSENVRVKRADKHVEETIEEVLDDIDEYLNGYYEERSRSQAGIENVLEDRVN